MNYQRVYNSIIEKAKSENRNKGKGIYYENHHILPKCLNGSNDKENLVLLTAREHFVAHKLLTYVYKGNYKIYHSFHLMCFMNKRKYGITSRDYAYAIELFRSIPVDHKGEKNTMFGKKHSKETRNKIRNKKLGKSDSITAKLNKSIAQNKRFLNKNERYKGSCPGNKNGMYGRCAYDIWVEQYGIEEANKRKNEANIKRKLSWENKRNIQNDRT